VSRMMGHTNITQTQRYAKVLAKDVYDDYERIAASMATVEVREREKTAEEPPTTNNNL